MIEILNVPAKMKRIFSGNNSAFILIYNKYTIEDEVVKRQGRITIINF